ncbi:MAG: proline dehydrogenase family protein [Crocinitomicaceae bacterium]|nr:proline dehydrogenase family protein [Crocinitomicaceae bacterium]
MISFDNTEIAFKSKSNTDLAKAYWLFKIIGNPKLVKVGKWATNTALNLNLPIKGIIKKTIFSQFCGGETISDCTKAITTLSNYGIGTILDYSIEGKTSDEDFNATVEEIIATIKAAANNPKIPFAVFKVTGISSFSILEKANDIHSVLSPEEEQKLSAIIQRIDKICAAAYSHSVPVFIDAEETWIQDTIDRITFDMMLKYNKEQAIVFNTLQMYRHDRLAFLKNEITQAKTHNVHYGVKLVRGAYMEKERERALKMGYPSPIQPDKKACDHDFNSALELIIENLDAMALCAGSHNEESAQLLTSLMNKKGIAAADKRVYFAQLLGMSDHISYNVAHAGYNVAKYVPYGPVKEVMPYLLRRADENTSVAGQTGRELSLIMKERNRRKGLN